MAFRLAVASLGVGAALLAGGAPSPRNGPVLIAAASDFGATALLALVGVRARGAGTVEPAPGPA